MKLSEAMRKGAAMKPQTSHNFINEHGTCALGAAADAVGLLNSCGVDSGKFTTAFPALASFADVFCPKCEEPAPLARMIMHLNDGHHEPRERIADWLSEMGL